MRVNPGCLLGTSAVGKSGKETLTALAIALALLLAGCATERKATEMEPDRQRSAASSPADDFIEDQTAEMAADDQNRAATATESTQPSVTHRDSPLPRRRRP